MTGKELGDLVGLGRNEMSRRLTGRVSFKADELELIAAALHIKVGDLYVEPVGRAAGNSGQHSVSPAPSPVEGESGSRERLDRPAAYPQRDAS